MTSNVNKELKQNRKLNLAVNIFYIVFFVVVILLSSCVTKKKYKQLNARYNSLDSSFNNLSGRYNDLTGRYSDLNRSKEEVEKMSKEELQKLNEQLQAKLAAIEETNKELAASNKKVNELQAAIQKQKDAQKELLNKINKALLGFNASDLTAELRKDGKVYVSLSEKLLFQSGKHDVDPKGKSALEKLASILSQQPDIDIVVEGHTDSIPLKKGGYLKDNIDLSVMRATSIVRLLSDDFKVNPKQLYASGRGEYFPIASNSTPEGRASNRRTEIILSPKIQELVKLLEEN